MNFGRNNFSKRGPRKPIPVKEGDEYEVIVEGIGSKGDGIARYSGFVIVVPGVELGDKIRVRVDAVRGKVSFGSLLEKLGKASSQEMPVPTARKEKPVKQAASDAENEEVSVSEDDDSGEFDDESEEDDDSGFFESDSA